jgi:hypothetical protein
MLSSPLRGLTTVPGSGADLGRIARTINDAGEEVTKRRTPDKPFSLAKF